MMGNSPLRVGYDGDQPWQYEVLNGAWANNGVINGLTFTAPSNGPIYISDQRPYEVQDCNVLQVTLVAQFNVLSVRNTVSGLLVPSGWENQPYYGAGLLQTYDPTTNLVYGFVLTNAMVYGLYGRTRTPDSTYAAFMYLVPIRERTNALQYNVLQLAFDKAHGVVTYRVDGSDRMKMDQSGRPLDSQFLLATYATGTQDILFPSTLRLSLGIMRLGAIYPSPAFNSSITAPCTTLYDYCDCQQSVQNLQNQVCAYNPTSPFLPLYSTSMQMVISSIQVNRLTDMTKLCQCGEDVSSSSCSSEQICKPSSSSSSESEPCQAHSSKFSYW